MKQTSEAAFETVIETHLLANGYVTVNRDSFDRERAIFPETVLSLIREIQPKGRVNLDARRTATEHTIIPLREHRAALIAAVVAGRIPTREHGRYFAQAMWR